MSERDAALPEEYTFRLARRHAVVTLLVISGGVVALALAEVFSMRHHLHGLGYVAVAAPLATWLVIQLLRNRSLFEPVPPAIRLDATGVHVLWPDRTEDWSWEAIEPSTSGFSQYELGSPPRERPLQLSFMGIADTTLFSRMLEHYAEDPVGRRDAERLAAGAAIAFPAHERRLIVLFVAACAIWPLYLVISDSRDLLGRLARLGEYPPHWAHVLTFLAIPLLATGMGVIAIVAWWVGRGLYGQVRFLPDGLEERWPGGRRLFPYAAIERITDQRTKPSGRWLIVQSGKQRLKLAGGMRYFWGAVRLLRERTPQAVWEERGG